MNINIRLNKNFTTQFNKLLTEYGEEFAKLNGLSDTYLNYTDFIDNFIDKDTVADASIDGNANVGHKDIVTLLNEMPKPHRKLLALNKIYYEMNKKYGFKEANKWLTLEWTRALYMHDADTSTFKSYCFAYDLKDLAEKGLFFLEGFNSSPPRHLGTFVDFIKEYVSFATNRSSGAVGMPNLIPYLYYFWDRDVKNGYYTETPERYAKQHIQRLIYGLNQPCTRDGLQSAFTNTSIFDHPYLEALFGGAIFPDGKFMIDEIEGIMNFQWMFLEEMSNIRSQNMFTFPVNTISLLRKEGKFVDEDFAKKAIKHNMKWSDSNIFADSSVNSLANCCRLKSNIEDLGFFNSIGGTALKVGSVKVSTINLARIALETTNEKDFLKLLQEKIKVNLEALDCVRHIIKRNIEKGLLPNYTKDLVDLKNQYNTIGVIGIYETMKTFGYVYQDELGNSFYKDEAYNFGRKIFKVIHNTKDNFILDKDYMVNVEAIPGEQAAVKMQKADELLFPNKVVKDLPLYGNQFIPLGIKTTLQERIKIAAAFDDFCNGGSILHVNLEGPFSNFEQAWDMLNYITNQGVTYFAFNTKIQACKYNHAFYGKTCPICGNPVENEYTRIVGFYTPVRTYSKERKEEFKMREWEKIN
jgi:ribonucleoside-triphosphate reductase